MRPIDADALLESERATGFAIGGRGGGKSLITLCRNYLYVHVTNAPTIDAVPVVHGVWERSVDNDCPMHKCSVCGARVVKGLYEYENPNLYCYHCGAKMDGERRSDD